LRQGLDFTRIEGETKIRGKYLRALEDEQFDALPGDTYVKGFLRTYAEFLGLDGQLYVDEYNSRFTTMEEVAAAPSASRQQRKQRRPVESNFVVVALAGIVAVTVLVVIGLAGIGSDSPEQTPLVGTTTQDPTTGPAETMPAGTGSAGPKEARPVRLVLTAIRGGCWMQVRAGGVNGKLVYEGTLEQGQTQRFLKHERLWLELGAPGNLNGKLNGRRVDFPQEPSILLVSARGVRTVSSAG
jgi:hypothetical protein